MPSDPRDLSAAGPETLASTVSNSSPLDRFVKANLALWDEWTEVHVGSPFYDVAGFRAGKQSLTEIELGELGPEVAGKSLLHLQCHFGLDTLSWARLGATVTGVDFSPRAIALARSLAADLGLEARFVCADLAAPETQLNGQFDIVFASWGVLVWLPDLGPWSRLVARCLRPGGSFYMAEFHPFLWTFDDVPGSGLRPRYPYFHSPEPQQFETAGSYADPEARVTQPVQYEWAHPLGDVVSALTGAGLRLEYLHEFPWCRGVVFPFLEKDDLGRQRVRGFEESFPLAFSLRASRSAVA